MDDFGVPLRRAGNLHVSLWMWWVSRDQDERLFHGRVLSKCLVRWQHAQACNVLLRTAHVKCFSHFLVLGLVRLFPLQHFWYASMPEWCPIAGRACMSAIYGALACLTDEKVQANVVGVETIGAFDVGTCRWLEQNAQPCKCLPFQPWQGSPLLQTSVKQKQSSRDTEVGFIRATESPVTEQVSMPGRCEKKWKEAVEHNVI